MLSSAPGAGRAEGEKRVLLSRKEHLLLEFCPSICYSCKSPITRKIISKNEIKQEIKLPFFFSYKVFSTQCHKTHMNWVLARANAL